MAYAADCGSAFCRFKSCYTPIFQLKNYTMYLYFVIIIIALSYINETTQIISRDTKAIIHIICIISTAILYYLDDILSKLNEKQPNDKSKKSDDGTT